MGRGEAFTGEDFTGEDQDLEYRSEPHQPLPDTDSLLKELSVGQSFTGPPGHEQPTLQLLLNITSSIAAIQANQEHATSALREMKITADEVKNLVARHNERFFELEQTLKAQQKFEDTDLELIRQILTTAKDKKVADVAFKMPLKVAIISAIVLVTLTVITTVILHYVLK